MAEPTDAELGQLAEECGIGWAAGLGGMDDFLRTFTRAVLAKWGTPPAVVVDPEVYQYQSEDGTWHEFLDHRHYNNTVADGRWPIRALYTTPQPTQAQAGAVPLTRERVKAILTECGYDGASAQHRADFINGLRHGEAAHGIKGGQHGADN